MDPPGLAYQGFVEWPTLTGTEILNVGAFRAIYRVRSTRTNGLIKHAYERTLGFSHMFASGPACETLSVDRVGGESDSPHRPSG